VGRGRTRAIRVSIVIVVTGGVEASTVIVAAGGAAVTIAAATIEGSAQTTMATAMADIAATHTDVEITAIITLHTTTITTVDLCLECRGRTELLLFIRINRAPASCFCTGTCLCRGRTGVCSGHAPRLLPFER